MKNNAQINEITSTQNISPFSAGLRAGIPIALGYFAVSFAFGLVAREGGLSVLQATLISLLNVTSAGQFAGLTVIFTNGTYAEIILTQFVINLRYALMSFSLSQKITKQATLPQRLLVAFGVTDEIYGVTSAYADHPSQGETGGRFPPAFSYGAMAAAIPGWVAGTFAGALLGGVLPVVLLNALSVALYGMFLAIIIPPARAERRILGVVCAAMVLSALFHVMPVLKEISEGFSIILVAVIVSGVAAFFDREGEVRDAA